MYVLAEHQTPSGWSTLKTYWASTNTVSKPSVANAYSWLLQFAQATLFSNCQVHAEVVDSLTRPSASFSTQRLPFKSGVTIPGKIVATDYDMGPEGLAYHDTVYDDEAGKGPAGVTWNSGWYGRDDGVDVGSCSDPGTPIKVGWNDAGEWQRHTVTCTPGNYTLQIRYGGGTSGGQLHVAVNGTNVSGTVALPSTGGYGTYSTYSVNNVPVIASGTGVVEIGCDAPGYDLVWIQFLAAAPLAPTGLTASADNIQVGLNWSAALGAASYNVKRSFTSGGAYTMIGSGVSGTNFTDSAVTNGGTYYYFVSAVNTAGQSTNSSPVSATVPLPNMTVAFSTTNLLMSWPFTASHFNLYSTPSLEAPVDWHLITNSVQNSNGVFSVILPTGTTNQFFRLGAP
jgi:hypothetical protein